MIEAIKASLGNPGTLASEDAFQVDCTSMHDASEALRTLGQAIGAIEPYLARRAEQHLPNAPPGSAMRAAGAVMTHNTLIDVLMEQDHLFRQHFSHCVGFPRSAEAP
jgi:hypothetical protein